MPATGSCRRIAPAWRWRNETAHSHLSMNGWGWSVFQSTSAKGQQMKRPPDGAWGLHRWPDLLPAEGTAVVTRARPHAGRSDTVSESAGRVGLRVGWAGEEASTASLPAICVSGSSAAMTPSRPVNSTEAFRQPLLPLRGGGPAPRPGHGDRTGRCEASCGDRLRAAQDDPSVEGVRPRHDPAGRGGGRSGAGGTERRGVGAFDCTGEAGEQGPRGPRLEYVRR